MTTVPAILLAALLGVSRAPRRRRIVPGRLRGDDQARAGPHRREDEERKVLEGAAEMLSALKLPRTLTLKASSCGDPTPGTTPTRT